ncbi:hypothetical protein D3C81_2088590 [compost metagenome]
MVKDFLNQGPAIDFRELDPFAEMIQGMHKLNIALMKLLEPGGELEMPTFDIQGSSGLPFLKHQALFFDLLDEPVEFPLSSGKFFRA